MAVSYTRSSPAYKGHSKLIIWLVCLLASGLSLCSFGSSGEIPRNRCRLQNRTVGVKADCSHLSLESIPGDLPLATSTLDASHNLIKILRNDSFKNLGNLTSLDLKVNLISHIEVGAFRSLCNLWLLDLERNNMTFLDVNIFDGNPLLSRLVLSFNGFSSVPSDALSSLRNLQMISLSYNYIQKADFTAFCHINETSKVDLELSGNHISFLQASDFKPLRNSLVGYLNLVDNKIERLPYKTFTHLKRVDALGLQYNDFREFQVTSFLGDMTIDRLYLSGCSIEKIIPLNTSSLPLNTSPAVDIIDISLNKIYSIPPYAFEGFNRTRKLVIAGNSITITTKTSFCGLGSVLHLDLSKNCISSLPWGIFSCTSHLQEVILSYNRILVVIPPSFSSTSLRKIDLSFNIIQYSSSSRWDNPGLSILDMSYNQYTYSSGTFGGNLSNLIILKISFNHLNRIVTIPKDMFVGAPSLQELYLNDMTGKGLYLQNEVFSRMTNLIKLDISSTEIQMGSIHQFRRTQSLQELSMSKSKLISGNLYDNTTQSSLFEGLMSLKSLVLKENNLIGLNSGVFSPLIKLETLDLSKTNIAYLEPNLFINLSRLRTLYLNHNRLKVTHSGFLLGLNNLGSLFIRDNMLKILDKNTFIATPNLTHLFLSGNYLREVQEGTYFPTTEQLLIDISGNPITCTCALSWFKHWLRVSNGVLLRADKTLCSDASFKPVIGKSILMFHPEEFCAIDVILLTGLSLSVSIFGYICVVLYHKRSWLRHKFLLFKLALAGAGRIVEQFKDVNYDFHLNLMFHEAEEEWVYQVLKPFLEQKMPQLQKVIYGDDDLRKEMFYVNALYDAIENSFKTVLLLSNRSICDIWCMTKVRLALEHVNETGLDKVIFIFVEDIEEDSLPNIVKSFINSNKPHMWWIDDDDERELFWIQFERSMGVNRAIMSITAL